MKQGVASNNELLVWMDLEMTGLNPITDIILEVACVVTTADLVPVVDKLSWVVKPTSGAFNQMSAEVTSMHEKSGLLAACAQADLTIEQIEAELIATLTQVIAPGVSPLCGNTISKDRQFIERYMPNFNALLHYRHVDVSTLKILAHLWHKLPQYVKPEGRHRALDDIHASIAELKYYRDQWLNQDIIND